MVLLDRIPAKKDENRRILSEATTVQVAEVALLFAESDLPAKTEWSMRVILLNPSKIRKFKRNPAASLRPKQCVRT